jgi:hypothetical protein
VSKYSGQRAQKSCENSIRNNCEGEIKFILNLFGFLD